MAGKRAVVTAGNTSAVTPLRPKRPCPECGRPSARDTYPFCSKRCKDIDLNRWLKGVYVIPGRDNEEETEDPPAPKPRDQE